MDQFSDSWYCYQFRYCSVNNLGLIINLNIFTNKDQILIEISDNGKGISEEKLQQLYSLFQLEPEEALKNENQQNIGLLNIHTRLKLYYGSSYGLNIRSHINEGTCVTVMLPLKEANHATHYDY